MKIHHLNCGTLCPYGFFPRNPYVMGCHCLLIELDQGLVLIDAGLGTADINQASSRFGALYLNSVRPKLSLEETALAQIQKLGFKPADVRHIILTHLDVDHVGGISDFPNAEIHVYLDEYQFANAPAKKGFLGKIRYRPVQWGHRPNWNFYNINGEKWHGFEACRELKGLPPEILAIPLIGHSIGHCGVAIETGTETLFHCGDAFYNSIELQKPHSLHATQLRTLQFYLAWNFRLLEKNRSRLSALKRDHQEINIFCSHDLENFKAMSST